MNQNKNLSMLACQISIPETTTTGERDAHLASSREKVAKCLSTSSVNLVVLPELSTVDYSRKSFDNLDKLAEPLDGPSFHCWQQIATTYGCHVTYSFPRIEDGCYFISLAVVGPDGELVGHYDKIHLAQFGASFEKEYFTRGKDTLVFEVNGYRLAPIICCDIRIPELSRVLTVERASDVILHCGAYSRDESFATWHAFATTRAVENQLFFLSLNRAGTQYGKSLFCWPWIDESNPPIHFLEHGEDFKFITIDREIIGSVRQKYAFLKDRLSSYVG